jgi:light-regulated signal transduction histidine kinase (bacteriophytochrome)
MKPYLKITLIYLILSVAWILLSDRAVLLLLGHDIAEFSYFQTFKGLFFVASTALFLFFLMRHYYKELALQNKRLEGMNGQLNNQKRQLERSNAELEQFAYVASHDLQEPLRMITGFLGQLNKNYASNLDERAKQYIHFAVDGATRMKQLILDILDYSRVGRLSGSVESVNISDLIKASIQEQEDEIKAHAISITVSTMPTIEVDRLAMHRIFHNLISNAIKYRELSRPATIEVKYADKTGFYEFSVSDNGIGIEPEYFDKIFVIFQRLHVRDEFPGSGVGLAIVKKSVDYLGGSVHVESEPGMGSTFYFTIPKGADHENS